MKSPSPRNRTLSLSGEERERLAKKLLKIDKPCKIDDVREKTIWMDVFESLRYLPANAVDLCFVDPPYNLSKVYNKTRFAIMEIDKYEQWLDSWVSQVVRLLKPTASIYICGDWRTSAAIYNVAKKYFIVQNRITFEREKGRGAMSNWKNCSEDIWFCTATKDYYFNAEAVKIKRKVLAPYRDAVGEAKDWGEEGNQKYRLTYPSNIWNDITIPFWSMAENTEHPTQKPEKLVAKIILASSKKGDVVFDPFLGSGTTSVVAKKLGRKYFGIEKEKDYACLAEKRLEMAEEDRGIQGYKGDVFWERNSHQK